MEKVPSSFRMMSGILQLHNQWPGNPVKFLDRDGSETTDKDNYLHLAVECIGAHNVHFLPAFLRCNIMVSKFSLAQAIREKTIGISDSPV